MFLCLAGWWMHTHRLPLGCAALPEGGPDNTISISVARVVDQPGVVCARVYNGTYEDLGYAAGAFRLHKSWLWVLWVPYFNLQDVVRSLLPGAPIVAFTGMIDLLPPTGRMDGYLPSFGLYHSPAPPGRYRVCFRYLAGKSEDERRVCSAAFWLP